jgi:hypothetical protein
MIFLHHTTHHTPHHRELGLDAPPWLWPGLGPNVITLK